MTFNCPSCNLAYSGEEWQGSSRLGGTHCVECYTNTDCPAFCSTEHDGTRWVRPYPLARFTCPETLRVFFPCWICNAWLPVQNVIEDCLGLQLYSGDIVCVDHETELFECDRCCELFPMDEECTTPCNSYCASCYSMLDDEEPNDDDDDSVVPTTTYYEKCRICLTERTHLHLLNELRLCRCEADVATSRREPVLLFEPA